jgi:hypothetical protein
MRLKSAKNGGRRNANLNLVRIPGNMGGRGKGDESMETPTRKIK